MSDRGPLAGKVAHPLELKRLFKGRVTGLNQQSVLLPEETLLDVTASLPVFPCNDNGTKLNQLCITQNVNHIHL